MSTTTQFHPHPDEPKEMPEQIGDEVIRLRARVADLEKINKNECDDWANDHTHLQNLCRQVGYDEHAVEGDEWGIRSITKLGDMLRAKCSPAVNSSTFTLADARTICELNQVCWSEGIGPCPDKLFKQIAIQHPQLCAEFSASCEESSFKA